MCQKKKKKGKGEEGVAVLNRLVGESFPGVAREPALGGGERVRNASQEEGRTDAEVSRSRDMTGILGKQQEASGAAERGQLGGVLVGWARSCGVLITERMLILTLSML